MKIPADKNDKSVELWSIKNGDNFIIELRPPSPPCKFAVTNSMRRSDYPDEMYKCFYRWTYHSQHFSDSPRSKCFKCRGIPFFCHCKCNHFRLVMALEFGYVFLLLSLGVRLTMANSSRSHRCTLIHIPLNCRCLIKAFHWQMSHCHNSWRLFFYLWWFLYASSWNLVPFDGPIQQFWFFETVSVINWTAKTMPINEVKWQSEKPWLPSDDERQRLCGNWNVA